MRLKFLALVFFCLALPSFIFAQAETPGLDPLELDQLRYVADVVISPKGDHAVFRKIVPRRPDETPGGPHVKVYRVPTSSSDEVAERPLIGGEANVGGLSYHPDGKLLTFIARRHGGSGEVYALPLEGGEAYQLTKTPHGVRSYKWRPDGKAIAFTSLAPLPEARARARKAGFEPVVFDEDFRHIQLWLWDLESGETECLTESLDATVFDYEFAPDGKTMALALAPRNLVDDSYMKKRLHLLDVASKKVTPLVDNPGKLGSFSWSPDGKNLAYISAADKRDPHAGMLYVVSLADRRVRALSDGFRGMYHTIEWADNTSMYANISIGVQTHLARVGLREGKRELLFGGQGIAFRDAKVYPGQKKALAAASTASHPAEVFSFDFSGEETQAARLTKSNPILDDTKLGRQEVLEIQARDGLVFEGLLIRPVDEKPDTRYPLVIVAHGGPESHYSNGWNTGYSTWGQVLAGRGYVVWMPNYRASTGYGVDFAKADHGDPMGGEFRDHLDAIAHLNEKGLIDPKRVGLGGGSYGGYTAAWAATKQSEHFAAAVSFVPFVDIRTKWLTSDIPDEFYLVHYEEKWPHEQEEFLAERSPLTYAQDCKTPLLLLGGDADPRVHPSQPHMLYRAVKMATETPVRYIQYKGEGHGNRKNVNRYDYLLRTLRWFEHYLQDGDSRKRPLPPIDVDYGAWLP